jgi:hypothetical protein
VYRSREFLNLNSRSFDYSPTGFFGTETVFHGRKVKRIQHFKKVPFINLGLLLGRTKSGESRIESQNPYEFLGPVASQLLDEAPYSLKSNLLKDFIHRNKVVLKKFRLPWFLPTALGGLGLPPYGTFVPRSIDLRLARLFNEGKVIQSGSSAHQTRLLEILAHIRRPKQETWLTWNYVQRRTKDLFGLSTLDYTRQISVSSSDNQKSFVNLESIQGLLAVEALFTHKDLFDLFSSEDVLFKLYIKQLKVSGVFKPRHFKEYKSSFPKHLSEKTRQSVEVYMLQREKQWNLLLSSKIPLPEPYSFNPFTNMVKYLHIPIGVQIRVGENPYFGNVLTTNITNSLIKL